MRGVISHMGSGLPRPATSPSRSSRSCTVELCGPADCVILAQNDYGPDQRVHPDRIADVSPVMFERLCGCPSSAGVMRGSWTVVGRSLTASDGYRVRTTMPDTLTLIRERHVRHEDHATGNPVCLYDYEPWPCDTAQALAHIDALTAAVERLAHFASAAAVLAR